MALPLPKVVADVGPGGPMVTSMRGQNALADDILSNKIKGVEAEYAPMTKYSEAASKLAYAQLMGPQFMAKLMGHDPILANMTEDQKKNALQLLYQSGTGQGTGKALMNMPGHPAQSQDSFSNFLANKLKGLFGGGQPQQAPQNNALDYGNRPQNVDLSGMQPGQSYTNNSPSLQNVSLRGQGADSGYAYNPDGSNQVASPQEIVAAGNQSGGPQVDLGSGVTGTLVPEVGTGYTPEMAAKQQAGRTFAENTGAQAGVVEEGKEAGKIRAQDIKELNDVVFNAETKQATLDDINGMIASPEIRELRQVTLAGRHEMSFYAKYGTPAQQQLVGRLYAQMGNIVKDSSRDFAGQFRKGEQQLLQGMKPNDADTIDSMTGKAESLSVMNKMLMERARLTSKYMSQYHVNKLQASEMADKKVNGQAIRDQVHNTLNPKPTDEDINFMAEKYKKTPDEIRKMLKAKGVL